ncbi:MAG: hypothetical protein JKP90_10910 [Desulfofustis sp. PB-SRB1]|nr:hypothetical protein [Desulfofustis sp. PB-SRB1]
MSARFTNDDGVGFSFSFDYDKGTREYYAFVRYPSGKAKEVWYDRKGYTRRVDIKRRHHRKCRGQRPPPVGHQCPRPDHRTGA